MICQRDCLFLKCMFFNSLSRIRWYSCVGLCFDLLSFSIELCVCFCVSTMQFLFLWICSIIWYQVLKYLQHCSFWSGLLWLFRSFVLPYEF
jgi:hypothetical protein